MDLKEINPDIDINHWYYQAKFLAAKKMLSDCGFWPPLSAEEAVIVDVGSGSGIFIEAFLQSLSIPPKSAYAVDKFYTQESLGSRNGINFVKELPEGVRPTDLFFFDILEHVENDLEFLKAWVKISKEKSHFFFSVPAFKCLWSSRDIFLGHKKRYCIREIEELATCAGLKVVRGIYFFACAFPFVLFLSKTLEPLSKFLGARYYYSGMKKVNPLVNYFLRGILNLEIKLGLSNRILGLSCLVVAEKP